MPGITGNARSRKLQLETGSNYRHSFITTERIFRPLFQKLLDDEYERAFR